MPPAELPLFPDLDPPPSNVGLRAREDALIAELVEYCSRFNLPVVLPDTFEAADAWGANCGPMSLAAVLGLPTVEAVRPLVQPFRGFMSPTDMTTALAMAAANSLCARASACRMSIGDRDPWPVLGLVRIQWLGPWCDPGVNPRAAYRMTHWIGVRDVLGAVEIYDATPNRWIPLERWARWCETLWPKRATGWAPVTRIDVAPKTCPKGQAAGSRNSD